MELVLLLHAAATWFMAGLIWFVQIVHYPLFAQVGATEFVRYEQLHQRMTAWVVGPGMLIELATGTALLRWGVRIGHASVWTGLVLIATIWLCTALISVPAHRSLTQKFTASVHNVLVRSNWIRTTAWTLRGLLVLWMIAATTSG